MVIMEDRVEARPARPFERAAFAAGCFWGVEEAFSFIKGVHSTTVGYMGGRVQNPTYEQVCTHRTGHAETVLVEFDPEAVRYETLLSAFWTMHDPTTLNRQGPDIGTQYRSAIFCFSPQQREAALASKRKQAMLFAKRKIVTEVVDAETFWRAEEYHQHYFLKHHGHGCKVRVGEVLS